MRKLSIVLAAVLCVTGCSSSRYVFTPPAATDPEAKIAFVHLRGVYDWQAPNDRQLYVQDRGRQWFQVDLLGPCIGLEYANRVRFLPSDSAGDFDRFSSIQMGRQLCKVQSVKKIAPPVKMSKEKAAAPAQNAA
jgi:hypothetical protein